jgi:hypothetical protein
LVRDETRRAEEEVITGASAMSRPTPEELITEWERKKAVKAAEREVIAAAERWVNDTSIWGEDDGYIDSYCTPIVYESLQRAVSKLQEVRGE